MEKTNKPDVMTPQSSGAVRRNLTAEGVSWNWG